MVLQIQTPPHTLDCNGGSNLIQGLDPRLLVGGPGLPDVPSHHREAGRWGCIGGACSRSPVGGLDLYELFYNDKDAPKLVCVEYFYYMLWY